MRVAFKLARKKMTAESRSHHLLQPEDKTRLTWKSRSTSKLLGQLKGHGVAPQTLLYQRVKRLNEIQLQNLISNNIDVASIRHMNLPPPSPIMRTAQQTRAQLICTHRQRTSSQSQKNQPHIAQMATRKNDRDGPYPLLNFCFPQHHHKNGSKTKRSRTQPSVRRYNKGINKTGNQAAAAGKNGQLTN